MKHYRHERHAGNGGDVFKHQVLLGLVNDLLERQPGPLSYWESHAGAGEFVLPPSWRNRDKQSWLSVRRKMADTLLYEYQPTNAQRYLGSWRLVHALGEHRVQLNLWEKKHSVCRRMQSLPQVEVCCGDGYEGIRNGSGDFVFIDPPYWPDPNSDIRKLKSVLPYIQSQFANWAVWYPIHLRNSLIKMGMRYGAKYQEQCWGKGNKKGAGMLLSPCRLG